MPWVLRRRKRNTLEYETGPYYESEVEAATRLEAVKAMQKAMRFITGLTNDAEYHVEEVNNEQG